ncbi:hypothetical protein D9M70_435790 [compost metagenome]
MARRIDCSSPGAVVADIMIGAIIRSPANTVGLAHVVVGAVVRAVADTMRPAVTVVCIIVLATPAACAPWTAIAAVVATFATVTRPTMATTVSASVAAMTTATSTAAMAATPTAAAAAAVTAATTAVATATATAATTSTAAAIFGIRAGETGHVIGYQDRRRGQDSANRQSQQTPLEQHDEPPFAVALPFAFRTQEPANTQPSIGAAGQPARLSICSMKRRLRFPHYPCRPVRFYAWEIFPQFEISAAGPSVNDRISGLVADVGDLKQRHARRRRRRGSGAAPPLQCAGPRSQS